MKDKYSSVISFSSYVEVTYIDGTSDVFRFEDLLEKTVFLDSLLQDDYVSFVAVSSYYIERYKEVD